MSRGAGLRRLVARLLPALMVLAVAAPVTMAGPGAAGPASRPAPAAAATTAARPGAKRPARKAKLSTGARQKRKGQTPAPPKGRPDRGVVDPAKLAAKAKVSTFALREERAGERRADSGKLTAAEQTADQIEKLLHTKLRDGTTSLYVADAATGKPLFSVYPDDPLNPASNVKLISSATALDILGPDYRYPTRLIGAPPDDAGVIDHDLYLLGSYDPTLGKAGLADLARQLAALGVTRLEGDVVVGPIPTRDGMYRTWGEVTVVAGAPGEHPTAKVSTPSEFIEVEVTATTAAKRKPAGKLTVTSEVYTDEGGHERLKLTVAGTIGRGRRLTRDIFIKERAQHTAHLLRAALRDLGIEVMGDVRVGALGDFVRGGVADGYLPMPLAEHLSDPAGTIIARVNKRSINWLADRMVVTAAAHKYGGEPSMAKAIDAMYAWLGRTTGLSRDDLVIDTGSGLSYKTELSARQLVAVLRAGLGLRDDDADGPADGVDPEDVHAAYHDSLAVGGVDGTLRRRFRGKHLKGHVIGKSGTLNRVIALSGLLEADNGRQVVFSIVTNGHKPSWKHRVREGHEQLVALLCDYLEHLPAPAPAELVTDETAPDAAVVAEDHGTYPPELDEEPAGDRDPEAVGGDADSADDERGSDDAE